MFLQDRHNDDGTPVKASTVNVAINVPVDNKKNAFFGVPFEGIIWHNFSLFCPQNLYKKANCNAKMIWHE